MLFHSLVHVTSLKGRRDDSLNSVNVFVQMKSAIDCHFVHRSSFHFQTTLEGSHVPHLNIRPIHIHIVGNDDDLLKCG